MTESAGLTSSALPFDLLNAFHPVPSPMRRQQMKMVRAESPIDLEKVEDVQNEENDAPDAVVDGDVVDIFPNPYLKTKETMSWTMTLSTTSFS